LSRPPFFNRDTLLLLRIPFSYYLFPVFLLGASVSAWNDPRSLLIVFIALHFFIYPGSNIYNSYMDRDTGSIGGVEHPPPVTRNMYYVSMLFDVTGILLCLFSGWKNVALVAGYIAFSKSYSWHGIRLKKYPFLGWLSVAFFQGGYTFMLASMVALDDVSMHWFTPSHLEGMLFASLMIGGSYPLTQIYQHAEDAARGDHSISYRLGIRGSFIFAGVFFLLAAIVALHYFSYWYTPRYFIIFSSCLAPVIMYFLYWFTGTLRNSNRADYRHSMWMNQIAATCMIICFCLFLADRFL